MKQLKETYIHPTAVIYPGVKIGTGCYIGAYAVIGAPAEDKGNWLSDDNKSVVIGDNVIINGSCTIDAST